MNKIIAIIIVVLIIIAGVFLFYRRGAENGQPTDAPQVTEPTEEPAIIEPTTPPPSEPAGPVIKATDSGFVPGAVQVKKGEPVTFVNESSHDVRPASALHPSHGVYPEGGGCINSKFDACRGLKSGESWAFTFIVKGEWPYHDHLNPGDRGKITVVE